MLPLFSHSVAPIKRRQLDGTTTVCYDTRIGPFLASWKQLLLLLFSTQITYQPLVDQYNDDLRTLFKSLTSQAAAGGSLSKFAAKKITVPESKTLFAFVQCTPDLSEQLCSDCLLGTVVQNFPQCCDGKEGGRVFKPSCNIRFEVFYFFVTPDAFTPSTPLAPPVSPPPSSNNTNGDTTTTTGRKRNTSRTIVIIVVPIVVLMLVIISICIFTKSRRPGKKVESNCKNSALAIYESKFTQFS